MDLDCGRLTNYRDNGYWSPEMVSLSKDGLSYAIGFQYHNYASSGEADPIIEVYSLIDNVPPSLSSSIQSEIDEGTQSIGTVGADESVTWSVLGDGISIDSGGVISLDLPADYETKTFHKFSIVAKDLSGNSTTSDEFIVTIADLDEIKPILDVNVETEINEGEFRLGYITSNESVTWSVMRLNFRLVLAAGYLQIVVLP